MCALKEPHYVLPTADDLAGMDWEGAELAEKLLVEGKVWVEEINDMAGLSNPSYLTAITLK